MVRAEIHKPARIAGGFVLIPVAQLMAAWRACRSATLGVGDFRAWIAMREMVARRCLASEGRAVAHGSTELANLLGVTEKRARASVRRLERAGLVEWATEGIVFPDHTLDDQEHVADSIGRGHGSIAVPRRMLRFLAKGARPAIIATVLGMLLRCLSRRNGGFDGRGRIKASWIANAFAVDQRRIVQARKELVARGWISPLPDAQRAMNRWGKLYRIDLAWEGLRSGGPSLPPLPAGERPEFVTPSVDPEPLPEREEDQEPAPGGPAGFQSQEKGGTSPPSPKAPQFRWPTSANSPASLPMGSPTEPVLTTAPTSATTAGRIDMLAYLQDPRLEDVQVADLEDTARLLELHDQAVAKGIVTANEADRLRFVGAAEHALAIGKANPAGLFAYLVHARCWRYSTQADEDRARRRLKQHDRPASVMAATLPTKVGDGVSEDARLVREVRAATMRAGFFRDPWPEFAARNPSWDRARWDAALRELGIG